MANDALAQILRNAFGAKSQAEIARALGVSQAAVSLWLSGRSRPYKSMLGKIARQFAVDLTELAQAAGYSTDDVSMFLVDDVPELSPELTEEVVAGVHALRLAGAMNEADNLIKFLSAIVPRPNSTLQAALRGQLLSEHIFIESARQPRERVLMIVRRDLEELEELGSCFSDDLWELAGFHRADLLHVDRRLSEAISQLEVLVTSTNNIMLRARGARSLALSLSYRQLPGDLSEFKKTRSRATRLMDKALQKDDIAHAIWLQEGIGRGLALFDDFELIRESKQELDEARARYVELATRGHAEKRLEVALDRARLIAACKGAYDMSTEDIFALAEDIKKQARANAFDRVANDIDRDVKKHLLRT